MKKEVVFTKDGSKTIFIPELNASYHSLFGAVQEAKHVFLKNGLELLKTEQKIAVLEIGLGTGLNAFLTLIEAQKQNKIVCYSALEAFPLTFEEAQLLAYHKLPEINSFSEEFLKIHHSEWEKKEEISPHFILHKIKQKAADFSPEKNSYHLVYFDAFGPGTQPEMWEKEILRKMYDALLPNGIFVTYCAKGEVRRNLLQIGFQVERIPGPPGKREMLRAIKPS